ncbi:NUDIX domain-containing protein [Candidatus Uabimicrobium sp. HlEnr_7]|uniref:NUDIX domain-containing protein n=1 Tax=Candidatus Uabimicrobium helgolandensis TaxID=3095367 RepID=UPI0035571932
MPRETIPSHFFTIIIIRRGHRFLLVQEKKGQWYFPGGGVLPREDLFQAAQRETLEEASISIFIEGIYRLEYIANPDGTSRFRIIFTARPVDDMLPKSEPDEETLQAKWFTVKEIEQLSLRSSEVLDIINDVLNGAAISSTDLLLTNPLKIRTL